MKRSFGTVGRRSAARRRILAPWVILLLGCGSGHGGSPDGGGNRGGGSGGANTGGAGAGGATGGGTGRGGGSGNVGSGGQAGGHAGTGGTTGGGGSLGSGGAAGGANSGRAGAGGATGGQAGGASIDGGTADRDADVLAPRLIAPLSTATVTSRRPAFHWKLASGTDGAQVQICRDRACSDLVATFEASGDHATPPAQLPSGVVFWRAYGRSGGALGAVPSPVWEVTVGVRSAGVDSSWGCTPDVNGDGFADLAIGTPGGGSGGLGAVHVYWGSAAGVPSAPSQTLAAPKTVGGAFGSRVTCAGDVDGDGFADVIVADQTGSGGTNHVYLFPGGPQGLASAPSVTLTGSGDLGFAMSMTFAAGDVNGDGYADVIIAGAGPNGGVEGALIYLGSATGLKTTPAITLTGADADAFGAEALGVGDINGDGYGDVVVTAPLYSSSLGRVYVYLGGPGGLSASATLTGTEAQGGFAGSVTSAGDVNGDGYADLLVSASSVNNYAGRAYVFLGGAGGLATTPAGTLTGPNTSFATFGTSLAGGGDLNADGYADIAVGTITNQDESVGHVYVYLGGAGGIGVTPAAILDGPYGPNGLFGVGLALPGDVDGDGYADLAVGAPFTGVYVGTAYLYPGTTSGVAASPSATLDGPDGVEGQFGVVIAGR